MTGNYYNFSNIRYAEPPVGELRFSEPLLPGSVNRTLDDGQRARICHQAYPKWLLEIYSKIYGIPAEVINMILMQDPRMSEDCLLLDVIVPVPVFERSSKKLTMNAQGSQGGQSYCSFTTAPIPSLYMYLVSGFFAENLNSVISYFSIHI